MVRPGCDGERGRRSDGGRQHRPVRNEKTRIPVDFTVVIDHATIGTRAEARATPRMNGNRPLDRPGLQAALGFQCADGVPNSLEDWLLFRIVVHMQAPLFESYRRRSRCLLPFR